VFVRDWANETQLVRRQDIAKLYHSLRATPRQANQVMAVLSKAFNLAEVRGLRPEHSNQVRLVKRCKGWGVPLSWQSIHANIPDVRIHDLCYTVGTFYSIATSPSPIAM